MSKDMSEICQIRLSKHMSEELSDENVRRYVRKNARKNVRNSSIATFTPVKAKKASSAPAASSA